MSRKNIWNAAVGTLLIAAFALPVTAAEQTHPPGFPAQDKEKIEKVFDSKPVYSPYANRNFPSLPLFGDTHLHTSYSMDAGASGTRLTAVDAYRFARGEQITSNTGQPVKLSRPLDFLVVADRNAEERCLWVAARLGAVEKVGRLADVGDEHFLAQ